MRFSVVVIAVALVLIDAASADDHLILVGLNNSVFFEPTTITAAAGDTVSFQFRGKNDSVIQSIFATPCVRQTTPSLGVTSDFMSVAAGASTFPQWSITVNDSTAPLWFFCAQINTVSHCDQGMVFSVNAPAAAILGGGQAPPENPTFAHGLVRRNPPTFVPSAMQIANPTFLPGPVQIDPANPTFVPGPVQTDPANPTFAPGPVISTGLGPPNDRTGPTTTAPSPTPVESSPASTPTTPDPTPTSAPVGGSNGQSTNKSKNIGPIVGGIAGGLMLIATAAAICIYQQRRKRIHKKVDLDLIAETNSPIFRSTPFRTTKRPPPSNTDVCSRMVMHEDSGIRMPLIGEHDYVPLPVIDVPPGYTFV